MVKTVPPATMPEVVLMARMLMFSMIVLRLKPSRRSSPDRPTARIEIGMAVSMPWPTLSAM